MSLKLVEVSDGSTIRAHGKVMRDIATEMKWDNFVLVEYRGKYLLGSVDQNMLTTVLAEIGPASPIVANNLKLKEAMPRVVQLPAEELEALFRLFITSFTYLKTADVTMSVIADKIDGTANLVEDLNNAIRVAKAELDAVEARVTAEANARIEAANKEIDKLKSEKAELQSQLEETKRSKKKLREALERMKEAR